LDMKEPHAVTAWGSFKAEFLKPDFLTNGIRYWFFFTRARWFAAFARACASISAWSASSDENSSSTPSDLS
jgi:hypothetical protein